MMTGIPAQWREALHLVREDWSKVRRHGLWGVLDSLKGVPVGKHVVPVAWNAVP